MAATESIMEAMDELASRELTGRTTMTLRPDHLNDLLIGGCAHPVELIRPKGRITVFRLTAHGLADLARRKAAILCRR